MTQGTRFPTQAFSTGGAGESSDGVPPQPFETFCYDAALSHAKIHKFKIVTYSSVLPKELYGNIVATDTVVENFITAQSWEAIMASAGAELSENRSIDIGLGICRGKNKDGEFIGGWAAEYVERFATPINDVAAKMQSRRLTMSMDHELSLRGIDQHVEFQCWHNHLNLIEPFDHCLTAMAFLNLEHTAPVQFDADTKEQQK